MKEKQDELEKEFLAAAAKLDRPMLPQWSKANVDEGLLFLHMQHHPF